MLFVNLILATFLIAELGFLGVVVKTRVQTPLFCGQRSSAGDLLLYFFSDRPFLTNWLTVGNSHTPFKKNFCYSSRPWKSPQDECQDNNRKYLAMSRYLKYLEPVSPSGRKV